MQSLEIRILTPDDIANYIEHLARHLPEPGIDGVVSQPFSKNEPIDKDKFKKKILERWSVIPGKGNWEVTWGLFDKENIVGHLELIGSSMEALSHRAKLGMGIETTYRSKGYGKLLVASAIKWTKEQDFLSWIDLDVFAHNKAAFNLYQSMGFQSVGLTKDRIRVDGQSIDDWHMILNLKENAVSNKSQSIFDPVVLNTEHVKIRPLKTVSWQKLAEGLLYDGSFHATNWGIKTPDDVKKMYENGLSALGAKRGNPIVFLNHDETEVLGMTNFMNVEPHNKMIEIGGTWINKKWQRSYVNTETKFALLQYCFETLKMNRVEFRIDSENYPSQKAVQRLGFHFDGMMARRKINANGIVRDYVFYSVTDLTWPKLKIQIEELLAKANLPEFKVIQEANRFRRENKIDQAFELILSSINQFPKSPDLYYLAGSICDAFRTETEAVGFYLKALDLDLRGFDRRDCLLGLASTYRSLGKYEESKKIFDTGIKEFPDYRPYQIFLALTEFNLKKPDQSMKRLLDQIIETTSDQEIRTYERALKYYSTRLNDIFD